MMTLARFSATGRWVHHVNEAVFEFNTQGLITRHQDRFNFWRWSRLALGTPGLLLGRTPVLEQKVPCSETSNLQKFMAFKKAKL